MGKTEHTMKAEIKLGLSVKDLVAALNKLSAEDRELFIENLLAATSPDYLKSIREAREDYRAGRVLTDDELGEG
jgi:hypothetical protein